MAVTIRQTARAPATHPQPTWPAVPPAMPDAACFLPRRTAGRPAGPPTLSWCCAPSAGAGGV